MTITASNGWIDLADKVVIVTGGASGIGAEIARSLTRNGATVVVADVRPEQVTKDLAVSAIACDTTDAASVERMVGETIATFGRIDALVNNAGVNRPRLLIDVRGEQPGYEATEADFDFITAVNQKGPFLCAQAVARRMAEAGGGVIVNISSEAGVEGSKGQSIYAATKAALNGFTRSWAKELGPQGIRVVGIAPGINKRTNMNNDENYRALAYTRGMNVDELEAIDATYARTIPLGRVGEHHEVADLVGYLVSDHSSYITGTTINITGGKSR
ncbi:sorbitol-6-phosphate dehydrogenase subunit [Agrococcus sp. ARC_14]|uniref:sorbitol-6-phosphate dehydrogenase subunit n=1 Tax=Agrococcus sp. ARC_14 TaxID=2919927 RepID=UPI001F057C78|nr:sorbitol-6-phosphate dehydrogenase subunit [Agrococcus sp. ARC_14]MCH1882518.1 sorbitol-6-phosphate dehydrogenase subunit [Agrococcus sp. ARC_14]